MTLKLDVLHLLYRMFQEKNGDTTNSYDAVDDFYAEMGYVYESQHLLEELGIAGTGDLQDILQTYERYLEGETKEESLIAKLNLNS